MPVMVKRLHGESIVIATCSGVLDVPTLKDMFAQTVALMSDADTVVYRIADYYGVTSTFTELLQNAQEASKDGAAGSTTDTRIKPMFVGSEVWQAQAREAFGKNPFGSVQIPIFGRVEDAIEYARLALRKLAAKD
ncbi:MAG: hypothetical protein ABI690_03025 [Chloroflexota bacterium]